MKLVNLIVAGLFWVICGYLVTRVVPDSLWILGGFFVCVFGAVTFSVLVFGRQTRTAILAAIGVTGVVVLRYNHLASVINVSLLILALVMLELYFAKN